MVRILWSRFWIINCQGRQREAERTIVEEIVVDGKIVEGTVVNGKIVEWTVVDGKIIEGTVVDGKIVEGTVVDGKIVEGTVVDGTVVEGKNNWRNSSWMMKNEKRVVEGSVVGDAVSKN